VLYLPFEKGRISTQFVLKKLGKFDTITGMGKPVRVRIFKSISVSSLYNQIGGRSRGSVNLPVVIRSPLQETNSYEAPHPDAG